MQDMLTALFIVAIATFGILFIIDLVRCVLLPCWNTAAQPIKIVQADTHNEIVDIQSNFVTNPTEEEISIAPVAPRLSKTKIKKLRKQELMDELLKIGIDPHPKLEGMRSQLLECQQ